MVEAVETNDPPSTVSGYLPKNAAKEQWTPETVLRTMPYRPLAGSSSPIPFFHLLERLKTTKREGWRRFGINHGESIADHMYRMSLITLCCPPSLASHLDIPRCMKMALIHDIAESLVGDITPVDGVSKVEKSRREEETVELLTRDLLGHVPSVGREASAILLGATGEEIRRIWREYEDDETLEAHFVHDVDKIELLLQMVEYERSHQGRVDLGEFSYVATAVKLPECKSWAEDIIKERHEFWDSLEMEVGDAADDYAVRPRGNVNGVANGNPATVERLKMLRKEKRDEYYGNKE